MSRLAREVRDRLKSLLHSAFVLGQKAGWDILPRHFYSGIPDVRELSRTELWRRPLAMTGVAGADIESQLRYLEACCGPALRQRVQMGGIHEHGFRENVESGYGPVEADFLYCFVAAKRPRRIVQVGSGVSTAVILLAAEETGYHPEVCCVDPFPTQYLKRLAEAQKITLVSQRAEEVDLRVLTELEPGDLLFIDSTHAARPGGEVNRIVLDVLPRLPAGSLVHFHDISFPYDYQPSVLSTLFFSGESTLLHAFLINNSKCRIAVSLSMLHHACPRRMQELLPNYRPAVLQNGLYTGAGTGGHFPSSTYLEMS
jgi:predicted O-methyltransferase YrrM